jgi:hypothetical protein
MNNFNKIKIDAIPFSSRLPEVGQRVILINARGGYDTVEFVEKVTLQKSWNIGFPFRCSRRIAVSRTGFTRTPLLLRAL